MSQVKTPHRGIMQGLYRFFIKGLLSGIYGVLTLAHMRAEGEGLTINSQNAGQRLSIIG